MIVIFAETQIKAERIEDFERAMREYEAAVTEFEPGCVLYCMARSTKGPGLYRNVEVFRDQAAVDAHGAADHFKTAIESTRGFFVGEPQVEICGSIR